MAHGQRSGRSKRLRRHQIDGAHAIRNLVVVLRWSKAVVGGTHRSYLATTKREAVGILAIHGEEDVKSRMVTEEKSSSRIAA